VIVLAWSLKLAIGLALIAAGPLRAAEPPLERWVYCSQNLWVDKNVERLESILTRAAQAGYTHALISDSKFGKLGEMDGRYFKNIERLKAFADRLHIELVPALFPIGYSNDILWHDPNLIEGLPVLDAKFIVENGALQPLPTETPLLSHGDFSDLAKWSWKDPTVTADTGTALIQNPAGTNARIVQKLKLQPFQQYHVAVRIKTRQFSGMPEVKVLAGDQSLNYNTLGVKSDQDWTEHHVIFNSLSNTEANIYFGAWGAKSGSLWFDDARMENAGLINVIRRDGAPLLARTEAGHPVVEGRDFDVIRDPRMGNQPWPGAYEVWHSAPLIRTSLTNGTRVRLSYYHAATVYDGQAMICPSEPKTMDLLRDQARRMHIAWGAKGYFMSHDEIRVLNWCAACQKRGLDAGQMLAENVRECVRILRAVNPGGRVYVWSDMFDPNHNAHANYYLVRGNLARAWEGLDPDVIVVPWYFEKRRESLAWFAGRGHQQVIAGYYDQAPEQVAQWLEAARGIKGVRGVMYTTWEQKYEDLERFSEVIRGHSTSSPK
jgi:hypothetical protein